MKAVDPISKPITLVSLFAGLEMLVTRCRSYGKSGTLAGKVVCSVLGLCCFGATTSKFQIRFFWRVLFAILFVVIPTGTLSHAAELSSESKPLRVSLEHFPPLVNADGSGLAVELLRRVEEISSLRFNIEIMPYSRARHLLHMGQTDVMGPVPLGLEDADFYRDAVELGWYVPTMMDLFVLDPELMAEEKLFDLELGTTLGNRDFLSELSGVSRNRFVETNLENLVQMLLAGRIQGIVFERASTLSTFYRMGVRDVYFRALKRVNAGLAVRADEHGEMLKNTLEPLLEKSASHGLFSTYKLFQRLPKKGVLSRDGEIYSLEDDAGSVPMPSEP